MHIDLEQVPLRAEGMTPAEVLLQRVAGAHVCGRHARRMSTRSWQVCAKWDTLATVIGEVTDGDHLVITWNGETVVDVPPRTVAHEGPVYERPVEQPD